MNDPFDMGALAAANGDAITTNPLDQESEDWLAWVEGYESVSDVDEEGEPLTD